MKHVRRDLQTVRTASEEFWPSRKFSIVILVQLLKLKITIDQPSTSIRKTMCYFHDHAKWIYLFIKAGTLIKKVVRQVNKAVVLAIPTCQFVAGPEQPDRDYEHWSRFFQFFATCTLPPLSSKLIPRSTWSGFPITAESNLRIPENALLLCYGTKARSKSMFKKLSFAFSIVYLKNTLSLLHKSILKKPQ